MALAARGKEDDTAGKDETIRAIDPLDY